MALLAMGLLAIHAIDNAESIDPLLSCVDVAAARANDCILREPT